MRGQTVQDEGFGVGGEHYVWRSGVKWDETMSVGIH